MVSGENMQRIAEGKTETSSRCPKVKFPVLQHHDEREQQVQNTCTGLDHIRRMGN